MHFQWVTSEKKETTIEYQKKACIHFRDSVGILFYIFFLYVFRERDFFSGTASHNCGLTLLKPAGQVLGLEVQEGFVLQS